MRSRNVSPGLDVILILIWSDSTRVPPVTAERSPPASRITGADSPVMADSSTDATPSVISPSEGMNSPAETSTRSPVRNFELGTCSTEPSLAMRFATVSDRALRSVSACALPRPSAIASAKFANRTVNQSQRVICRLNLKARPPLKRRTVVMTLPISTTNMTGLPLILRGLSFSSESQIARRTIFHSQTAFDFLDISNEPSAVSHQPSAKPSDPRFVFSPLQPPPPDCNSRPDSFNQAEGPRALQKSVYRSQSAGDRKGQDVPIASRFERVRHQHQAHRKKSKRGK